MSGSLEFSTGCPRWVVGIQPPRHHLLLPKVCGNGKLRSGAGFQTPTLTLTAQDKWLALFFPLNHFGLFGTSFAWLSDNPCQVLSQGAGSEQRMLRCQHCKWLPTHCTTVPTLRISKPNEASLPVVLKHPAFIISLPPL